MVIVIMNNTEKIEPLSIDAVVTIDEVR